MTLSEEEYETPVSSLSPWYVFPLLLILMMKMKKKVILTLCQTIIPIPVTHILTCVKVSTITNSLKKFFILDKIEEFYEKQWQQQ